MKSKIQVVKNFVRENYGLIIIGVAVGVVGYALNKHDTAAVITINEDMIKRMISSGNGLIVPTNLGDVIIMVAPQK